MRIAILGPQGSGKTTQGKLLAEYLKFPLIDAGTLIRSFVETDPNHEEAEYVKQALLKGELIPNEIAGRLVREAVEKDSKEGFVLDGYPRSMDQVKVYFPETDKVIYLRLSKEECVRRLTLRKRADDTPESIERRLELYHELTEPLLSYFKEKNLLLEINADSSVEEIQANIKKELAI